MKSPSIKKYLLFLLSFLLISTIKAKEITITLSSQEQDIVLTNSETPYAYLGNELSDIAQVVTAVSNLYDGEESKGVRELQEHLSLGYKVGKRDAVVAVLKGVLPALKKDDHAKELTQRVEHVVEKLQ
ncbi:MAG: hypothetical protein WCD44_01715, partial [Candidatus Babeliales bacterium]